MEWTEVGTREEETGTRVLPLMVDPLLQDRAPWGTWDSLPKGLEDTNNSSPRQDRDFLPSKDPLHSRITKGTNLPLDTSKVDGVDNPLMHHQGNKVPGHPHPLLFPRQCPLLQMPNSLMLDIHLHKEATASSPPPQPTLSGEPQPVPLWPLSLLQPSPLPSSPPNPPIALTDNHQLQLLLLLHPVTPQPLGHSLTVHITM